MKGLMVLAAIALAACPSSAPMSSDIVLSEFDLQMQPSLASIATSLEIQNDGEFGHTVVVADGSGRIVAATARIGSGET